MSIYYIYAYLREDGSPYYIGKGKEYRAFVRHKPISRPKDRSKIIFLDKNLTEEQAFQLEKDYISILGRKDNGTGILRNLTDGGEGNSGGSYKRNPHSEETKRKMSDTAKRRKSISIETRNKMKEAWKHRLPCTEEAKKKMSISQKKRLRLPLTDITKQKISIANKGKNRSIETRTKISVSRKKLFNSYMYL